MARAITTIRIDMSGTRPLFASMETLWEALSTAEADGEVELSTDREGVTFEGHLIAAIRIASINGGIAYMRAVPTFWLPAFAAEICRIAPGVKVRWLDGWPHFSAPDWDDQPEDDPLPVHPETLVPA